MSRELSGQPLRAPVAPYTAILFKEQNTLLRAICYDQGKMVFSINVDRKAKLLVRGVLVTLMIARRFWARKMTERQRYIYIYFLGIRLLVRAHSLYFTVDNSSDEHIADISVSKPTPWAVVGPHAWAAGEYEYFINIRIRKCVTNSKRCSLVIFEHTCAYARWAHMHRFLSVCPSVRPWLDQKFRLDNKSLDQNSVCEYAQCLQVSNCKLRACKLQTC